MIRRTFVLVPAFPTFAPIEVSLQLVHRLGLLAIDNLSSVLLLSASFLLAVIAHWNVGQGAFVSAQGLIIEEVGLDLFTVDESTSGVPRLSSYKENEVVCADALDI